MKKIDAILKGKLDEKLVGTKKMKIEKAIEVAILNAEEEIITLECKYQDLMMNLATSSDISSVISKLADIKQSIVDIKWGIRALHALKKDLNSEVTPIE